MPPPPQPRQSSRRDPALDGLRGLAILLVFLFHYGGGLRAHNPLVRSLGYLTQAGWIGVELFFALSGFLITGLLADNLLDSESQAGHPAKNQSARLRSARFLLRNFYARRALRILPLYYAALLACAATALLTGAHLAQLKPLAIYAVFLQNLPPLVTPALHTPPPLPIFHLWSLAVEEQFYLLWPLLLLAAKTPRRALQLSLWTFALASFFRAVFFNPHLIPFATAQTFAVFLPTRAGALTLGAALALYHRRPIRNAPLPHSTVISTEAQLSGDTRSFNARAEGTSPSQTMLLLAIAAALTVLLLTTLLTHNLLLNTPAAYTVTLPVVDILCAALVALSLQPNLLRRMLSLQPIQLMGRISYGFYVFHILLEPLFDHFGALLTHTHAGFAYQTARLLTAFPITTAAAWFSFTLFERPFLRLKRHFPAPTTPGNPATPFASASTPEFPAQDCAQNPRSTSP